MIASGGRGGDLKVWEEATGRLARTYPTTAMVRAAVFTDARTLVTGDGDGVRWWDVATGRPAPAVAGAGATGGLARTPDGRTLVAATETGQVVFRDAATVVERFRGSGPPKRLTSVAVAPDGKTVVTGGFDGAVRLWHAGTGDELFPLTAGGPPVYGVAFSPDGTVLAAARHDGRLLLWPTTDP
jgi:WD40 repeat protein